MQFPAIAKLLTLAALAAGSAFAHADSAYPDRPIRMIIPTRPAVRSIRSAACSARSWRAA